MSMKKTIAAISAATVAMSAMVATINANDTVYADNNSTENTAPQSITYSLVKEEAGETVNGNVKLSASIAKGSGEVTSALKVPAMYKPTEDTHVVVRVIGTYGDAPIDRTYNSNIEATNYNPNVINILPKYDADTESYTAATGFTVPDFADFTQFAGYIEISFDHGYEDATDYNSSTQGGKLELATGKEVSLQAIEFSGETDGDKVLTPYKSTLNGGEETTGDIMDVLEDKGYVNAQAVINDIVANFNDVQITFNTATSSVKDDVYSTADDAIDYTEFTQGTFNLYDQDSSGNIGLPGFDWSNSNLHNAAIVVNNQYTMAYSQIVPFEVDGKAITFDMNNFNEDYETSDFVKYIHNMQLATTTDWYWDNMVITYANSEVGDAGSGEGMEDDGSDLEEEVVTTTAAEIVTEPEVETDALVEEEVVSPEENPDTGNAAVALAVVPVAVAAAAIIIKKRNK